MAWYTIHDAVRRGPDAKTWEGRARAGEVASYVDPRGRRWVWIEDEAQPVDPWQLQNDLSPVWEHVASLRREVVALRRRLAAQAETERDATQPAASAHAVTPLPSRQAPAQLSAAAPSPAPSPFAPVLAIRLAPAQGQAPDLDHQEILDLYAARWTGSDRELERRAGLPKAFLAKAKKGQRSGPRSRSSWERLAAFLNELSEDAPAKRAA
jgi:hypothetical protein